MRYGKIFQIATQHKYLKREVRAVFRKAVNYAEVEHSFPGNSNLKVKFAASENFKIRAPISAVRLARAGSWGPARQEHFIQRVRFSLHRLGVRLLLLQPVRDKLPRDMVSYGKTITSKSLC